VYEIDESACRSNLNVIVVLKEFSFDTFGQLSTRLFLWFQRKFYHRCWIEEYLLT